MGIISREDYMMVFGRGVGNSLTDFLDSADRRIWVVSPRIDEKYARQLKRKYNRGVDVKLAMEDGAGSEDALKQLLDSKQKGGSSFFYNYRFLFLFATLLALAGTALGFWFESQFVAVPVALAVIFGGLTFLGYVFSGEKFSYTSPMDLYISGRNSSITGSRIYLLDDRVFVGSADLTEDALWKNMEILFELKDEEAKNKVESMFGNIVNELERSDAGVEDVDRELFENK